jgi:large subunit ribosomal protein L32e
MKKKSKPNFVVPNSKSIMRVPSRWRKPRGIDSKKRIRQASEGACPRIGYKNAPEVRFLHPSGMKEIMIHNTKEIVEGMKNVVLRIAGSVGGRKRVEIQKKADSLKLRVLNPAKPREIQKKELPKEKKEGEKK